MQFSDFRSLNYCSSSFQNCFSTTNSALDVHLSIPTEKFVKWIIQTESFFFNLLFDFLSSLMVVFFLKSLLSHNTLHTKITKKINFSIKNQIFIFCSSGLMMNFFLNFIYVYVYLCSMFSRCWKNNIGKKNYVFKRKRTQEFYFCLNLESVLNYGVRIVWNDWTNQKHVSLASLLVFNWLWKLKRRLLLLYRAFRQLCIRRSLAWIYLAPIHAHRIKRKRLSALLACNMQHTTHMCCPSLLLVQRMQWN